MGSIANCITLVIIVIAPTAISPPYLRSDELKQTEITLSLLCIIKVARPRATHGKTSYASIFISDTLSFRYVFFPLRKEITQMHEIA